MALEIIVQDFEGLSEHEKLGVPNNGSGKMYASYLRVLHNGETISLFSDAMEPEDAQFCRDLKWVKRMILLAYQLGTEDQP